MINREQHLDDFLNHYCDVFNTAIKEDTDLASTAELFATCFVAANPAGVNCGQNDDSFRAAMQNGYAFYRSIGVTSMHIMSKEITLLDNFHAMARVHWKSEFVKKDGNKGSLEFENIYFIQTRDRQSKVFAYITGDEQAALKEAGLI